MNRIFPPGCSNRRKYSPEGMSSPRVDVVIPIGETNQISQRVISYSLCSGRNGALFSLCALWLSFSPSVSALLIIDLRVFLLNTKHDGIQLITGSIPIPIRRLIPVILDGFHRFSYKVEKEVNFCVFQEANWWLHYILVGPLKRFQFIHSSNLPLTFSKNYPSFASRT